jgi:hypothetical protein
METDIGNPIEYTPEVMDDQQSEGPSYYYQPPPPQPEPPQQQKTDIFANIEKSTWIIAFAVFLLGFFMGKTMQPVILRYT